MKKFTFVLLALGAMSTAVECFGAEEYRLFTNTAGRTVKARLISFSNGVATIMTETGQSFPMKLEALSPADREYVQANSPGAPNDKVTPDAINEAAGQKVFSEASLWESNADEVAQRLSLKPESKTKLESSFRAYPAETYRLFGARPFSVALYGVGDKPTSLSLVYANKGDSFGAKGGAELHFDKNEIPPEAKAHLVKMMKADVEAISAVLTGKLGEPTKIRFGDGAARETVQRWNWRGHAVLLKEVDMEYVGVEIVTAAFADRGGMAERTSESVIRQRVLGNLERRPNGDVVIGDLPMVDQGPKGYCAPATMERAMRHLGLSADMYVLANKGGTSLGGGTNMYALLDGVGRFIRRKGRKFDEWQGEMKLKEIAKYVDKGVPIIWGLSSTKAFNAIADDRLKERTAVTEWASWKTKMEEAAATTALQPDAVSNHVVLIMGYNAETNEIAFSDSWGERFKERWITLPEAEKVSQQRFYVVTF